MKTHSSKSIILGHKNLGETDRLIFMYNENLGKIKVIAKGARKLTSKFTGHLETLNIAETSLYFGPRNTILTEIETVKNFKTIREDLKKLNCALQIVETSNRLLYENQKIENLLSLFEQTLDKINTAQKPQLTAIYYIIKLMDSTGLIPNFKESKSTIERKYLKFLHYTQNQSFQEVEKISLSGNEEKDIMSLLAGIIGYHTDSLPNSFIRRI